MKLFECSFFKKEIPSELRPVQETIKLAMKPWNYFVSDYGYSGKRIKTPMVNIVSKDYIPDMASALRVANLIICTARDEMKPDLYSNNQFTRLRITDNGLFFHHSAVNLLASTLFYFVHKMPTDGFGDDNYADLPHVLTFLQLDSGKILQVLETCDPIHFAMLPMTTCYKEKAWDEFAAMMSTLYVNLVPLATPENYFLLHHSNTKGERFMDVASDWDAKVILRNCLEETRQETRDYVDYLLGIKSMPLQSVTNPFSVRMSEHKDFFNEELSEQDCYLKDEDLCAETLEKVLRNAIREQTQDVNK